MELVRNAFGPIAGAAEGMVAWIGRSDDAKTALLVLLLTPFLRFLWLGASSLYQYFLEWRQRRIERCPISLGPIAATACDDRLPEEVPIRCLIIRYGSDEYLEGPASDQERFEGRLRYKIVKSKLRLDPGSFYSGVVKLRVHRRLGTQFKLFFEVGSDREAKRYFDLLSGLTNLVEDVSISPDGAKPKIWFLLKRYCITGARIRNNFFFPV